jgi:glycosyltransferase involved in cell wall biosynthesis
VKVVLVTSLERGGPLEQALTLAAGLTARGAEVRMVCASPDQAERAEQSGAEPVVLRLRHPLDLSHGLHLRDCLERADVVHAQDRRSGLWLRLRPPPRPAVRVYTLHGLPDPYLPPPAGPPHPGARATLAYRGVDALLARRVDALVVPSAALARVFRERLGFPAERMRVIPNGVVIPERTVRPGDALVGCMSVLEPVKALDVFLRAAARLARDRGDVRFALYGTGSEEPRLRALATELGLGDRLDAPGHVPAPDALARLTVFVLCSYMENCPMSLLEAMAAGIPVVASRVGGVPEIVSDGTGVGVPPPESAAPSSVFAAAVAGFLDDPDRSANVAAAGRRRVAERFNADTNADVTLRLYEDLLTAHR